MLYLNFEAVLTTLHWIHTLGKNLVALKIHTHIWVFSEGKNKTVEKI